MISGVTGENLGTRELCDTELTLKGLRLLTTRVSVIPSRSPWQRTFVEVVGNSVRDLCFNAVISESSSELVSDVRGTRSAKMFGQTGESRVDTRDGSVATRKLFPRAASKPW